MYLLVLVNERQTPAKISHDLQQGFRVQLGQAFEWRETSVLIFINILMKVYVTEFHIERVRQPSVAINGDKIFMGVVNAELFDRTKLVQYVVLRKTRKGPQQFPCENGENVVDRCGSIWNRDFRCGWFHMSDL